MSGCLTDEMLATVKTLTDATPKVLDISEFYSFEKTMPVIENNNFYIPVSEPLQDMTQAYTFQIALFDESHSQIIYYGQDEYVYMDGEGNLCSDFNGNDAYLLFAYNRDTEEFEIRGVSLFPTNEEEQDNFIVDTKNNIELKPKDTIVPVYPASDFTGMNFEIEGKKITFSASSRIEMKALQNGYYLAMANICDQRGDSYSSKVIGYDISGGKIKLCEINPDFVGTDY